MSSDEPEAAGPAGAAGAAGAVDPAGPAGPAPERRFTVRRAPRYRPFGVTGGFLGVVAGVVVGLLPAPPVLDQETYSTGSVIGYFVAGFGLVGALLGLGLALILERRRS